jgi:S1-C subfamily serine protease
MFRRSFFLIVLVLAGLVPLRGTAQGNLNEAYERASVAALKKVGPAVVQIVTQGGTDMVVTTPKGPVFRKALGPTTGVIVSPDGYIISSAFNFINSPTNILVEVPGRKDKYVAKKVATDKSRMLTLLKIDAKDLPVPTVVPRKDLRVGQWALALGRTLDTDPNNLPSVNVGVISAKGRIWGKCIQTDAHTSPANYGGPLVDIQGRVQGIIIPASPQGNEETAGFEWYDSGIGFAVPMEDVLAVVPKLQKGADLQKGQLGVRLQSPDMYGATPIIASIEPNTAAAKAGLKAGDVITEIDGKPVVRMTQILHLIGPKYEGDKISLKYKRGANEVVVQDLELVGKMAVVANAYLGILPVRDDPKLGVEIRFVYPDSPAAKAGLKAGDRIVKYGIDKNVQSFKGKEFGRMELHDFLGTVRPKAEIYLEVARKAGKKETIPVTLAEFPGTALTDKDAPPKKLPELATLKKALESPEPGPGQPKPAKKDKIKQDEVKTGLLQLTTASGNHKYWIYLHEDYDPNISCAMLVWLHPPGKNKEKDIDEVATAWDDFCGKNNIVIVAPINDSVNGWAPNDLATIQEVVRDALTKYTLDQQRIVAHGLGVGGQMGIYLGFNARDLIRGVATTGAIATGVKDNQPDRPLAFYLVVGERDPLAKAINDSRSKLADHRIPTIYREIAGAGRQYLDEATLDELARWIDSLDRM